MEMSRSLPLLVFEPTTSTGDRDEGMTTLLFSLSESEQSTGSGLALPETMAARDNTCFSTPQGWVLVLGEVSDAWLWHPVTGDTLSLPPIRDDHYIPVDCKCLLTHKSVADPDCAVVLLDVTDPNMWFCRVSGVGGWGHSTYDLLLASQSEEEEEEEDCTVPAKMEAVIGNVAALGGKLHCTFTESNREKLCVVDLHFSPPGLGGDDDAPPPEAVFRKLDVPNLEFPPGMCFGKVWLVESRDELLAVCVFFVGFDPDDIGAVRVYRMDDLVHLDDDDDDEKKKKKKKKTRPSWRRLHSVGDRALLLSGTNMATWCSAARHNNKSNGNSLLRGDAVYFLKNFRTDDGDLCVYDLQKQSMEIVRVHDRDDMLLARTKPYWINVPPC